MVEYRNLPALKSTMIIMKFSEREKRSANLKGTIFVRLKALNTPTELKSSN